jgi:hypothetical protein
MKMSVVVIAGTRDSRAKKMNIPVGALALFAPFFYLGKTVEILSCHNLIE